MRAFLSVKMDRPIGVEHYISPGGYEVVAAGKSYQFDFNESRGIVNAPDDPSLIHFELRDEDYDTFPEIAELRKHLHEITELTECYIYTGEAGDPEIVPVKLLKFEIWDYGDGERECPEETEFVKCELINTQFGWQLYCTFKNKLLEQAFKEDLTK